MPSLSELSSNLSNDKRSDIGVLCRHGNRAEDSIELTPRDNTDIIPGVLFQLAVAFGDDGAGRICLDGSRLVPIPFSVRIGGDEHIVAVTAIYDRPGDLHLQVFRGGAHVLTGEFSG